MKKGFVIITLSFLLIMVMLLMACTEKTTTTSSATTSSPPTTQQTTAVATTTQAPATTAATATQGNWWDKFGTPQYGGTLKLRTTNGGAVAWDPLNPSGTPTETVCLEDLFFTDWTLDRSTWSFQLGFNPPQYYQGLIAKSWEWKDPTTITINLKHDVHFQNKPPVNGRELTADDVVFTYDRMLGTGEGFTQRNPFFGGMLSSIKQAVAVDKYTVNIELNSPSIWAIYQVFSGVNGIEAKEWYEQGDLGNWHNSVGTGAWEVSNYVEGSEIDFTKNPDYWGYDERFPQNKLPYADKYEEISIPDINTSIAALRTGKVDFILDVMGGLSLAQAQQLSKTNPDIQQAILPSGGLSISLNCSKEPFNNINVRKALQMSIDRKAIAKGHYLGLVDGTPQGIISPVLTGYSTPYAQWPADLQQNYSYDVSQAKQLMSAAGYSDGFNVNCVTSSNFDMDLLIAMQSYFKAINVNMNIQPMDMPTYQNYISSGKGTAEMCANQGGPGEPWNLLQGLMTGSPHNYTRNNDTTYDGMVNDFLNATDIKSAQQICAKANLYMLQQNWEIEVCSSGNPIVWQPWIKEFSGESTSGPMGIYYMDRLWIDQSIKK